jgi:hypothetical protein
VTGKESRLPVPPLAGLTGLLAVRLHRSGGQCWAADFAPPYGFKKNTLRARSE